MSKGKKNHTIANAKIKSNSTPFSFQQNVLLRLSHLQISKPNQTFSQTGNPGTLYPSFLAQYTSKLTPSQGLYRIICFVSGLPISLVLQTS